MCLIWYHKSTILHKSLNPVAMQHVAFGLDSIAGDKLRSRGKKHGEVGELS